MEFNSQICTTREQSERLLSLGLKKETADMVWLNHALTEDYDYWRSAPIYKEWEEWQKDGIPAWSLHRLLMMIDSDVQTDGRYISLPNYGFVKNDNIYDNLCDSIEWLIKKGSFNKKYLEE